MTKLKYLFFSIAFLSLFTNCAKRGTISGGVKDTIAPKIVSSNPENYSTNFKGNSIKINFNELIKVKDITKQLIISPPLKNKPIIVPQGSASKFISIKITDTLQENTTYSFNFGQSIADNNENNPYSQFKYVFSTGSLIDSLTVVGKIKDAYNQKPDNFVSVLLYDAKTYTDSTVYKETPLYITNTLDSLKFFSLENLKEGSYRIIALKDLANNNKFDPKSDKIAFMKEAITLPTETLFEMELFKEVLPFKAEKPIQESNNKLYLGFQGDPKNLKVSATNKGTTIPIRVTKFPEKATDSLQLFFPEMAKDSITFTLEKEQYRKEFTTKIKNFKVSDSISISNNTGAILSFRNPLVLKTKTPIDKIDNSKISITKKDKKQVEFTSKYDEFNQEIQLDFPKEEQQNYKIQILPAAFEDFYKRQNDTIKFDVSTKLISDYGNLKVKLIGAKKFPIIVELLDEKSTVLYRESITKNEPILFDSIEPQLYTLRIIYDENDNQEWDTGNFLEKKQAEEIIYFPKLIDVRANWDVEQEFELD